MESADDLAASNEPTAGPSGTQNQSSRRSRIETTEEEGSSSETSRPHQEQHEDSNMTNAEESNDTFASSSSSSTARNRKDTTTTDDDDEDDNKLLNHDPTPCHAYPVPKWFSVKQLQEREHGRNLVSNGQSSFKSCVNGTVFQTFYSYLLICLLFVSS